MTFDVERKDILKRFLTVEIRATFVLLVRAIPSLIFWIGLMVWALN